MKSLKLTNKTYQPLQLIIDNSVYIVGSRGNNNIIIIPHLTIQIQNLVDKELIKISKVR